MLIVAGYHFSWKPSFYIKFFHAEAGLVHIKDKAFHVGPRSPFIMFPQWYKYKVYHTPI